MTLEQLLTLVSIEQYGSFKAASEQLYKSQPSLSMAIKKLEEEFQIEIFDRSGYRPEFTDQGKLFLEQAHKVLAEAKKLEKIGNELSAGVETEIKICSDAIFPICHFADIFKSFFNHSTHTKLNLNTDVLEGVINQVLEHKVDFALGPDISDNSDLEAIKVFSNPLPAVINKKHFLKPEFGIDMLRDLPQVVVESSSTEHRGKLRNAISHQQWFTSDFSMKKQLITAGLGWGRLPAHQIQYELDSGELIEITGVIEVPLRDIPMYLLRSKSKVFGPNTKKLWAELVKLKIK